MGSKRGSGKNEEGAKISSEDLINVFRGGEKPVKAVASKLISVFDVQPEDVFEAWNLYRMLRDAGMTQKLAVRHLSQKYPRVFTTEVRDYLTALMLDTLTADMISEVKCG